MKHTIIFFVLASVLMTGLYSCDGEQKPHGFVGTFADTFNNRFTLNADYTAYIQLAGNEKVDTTSWSDGDQHDRQYATIEFNGDMTHFYLANGFLYRNEADMYGETMGLKIKYVDDVE